MNKKCIDDAVATTASILDLDLAGLYLNSDRVLPDFMHAMDENSIASECRNLGLAENSLRGQLEYAEDHYLERATNSDISLDSPESKDSDARTIETQLLTDDSGYFSFQSVSSFQKGVEISSCSGTYGDPMFNQPIGIVQLHSYSTTSTHVTHHLPIWKQIESEDNHHAVRQLHLTDKCFSVVPPRDRVVTADKSSEELPRSDTNSTEKNDCVYAVYLQHDDTASMEDGKVTTHQDICLGTAVYSLANISVYWSSILRVPEPAANQRMRFLLAANLLALVLSVRELTFVPRRDIMWTNFRGTLLVKRPRILHNIQTNCRTLAVPILGSQMLLA